MPSTLIDLVKITATSTGTGAITLGSAVQGYRGVEALQVGNTYSCSIQQGAAWEFGRYQLLLVGGQYQLLRTVLGSSNGTTPINLIAGASVAFTALSSDLEQAQQPFGFGPPASTAGDVGDFYYDLTNLALYGPKTLTGWGSPYSLVGPAGPSNNTRASLAALKAAATTDLSSIYNSRLWWWTLGDFSAAPSTDLDVTVVKADSTSLSTGAWVRTADVVNVSTYGGTDAALQAAINSGVREVLIDRNLLIAADVTLRSNQTLRFTGGKLTVTAGATIANAVLNGSGLTGVVIIDPVIDASAKSAGTGTPGVRLYNTAASRVTGGKLTRCNLRLESSDNTITRSLAVGALTVNMDGWLTTAVYVSGVLNASLSAVEAYGGLEGFGVYNTASGITFEGCNSHNHTQDGFVVIAGTHIHYSGCRGYSNGQSGFTTQRQGASSDTRYVTYSGCKAWSNTFDGFDIRGKTSGTPYGVDTFYTLSGCESRNNTGTGFYVVLAEGTTLEGCSALLNAQQNLFIDTSDRVIVTGFRSTSGASAVSSGTNKAGILVYNSANAQIVGAISGNAEGANQAYGVSFTGTSAGGRVVGGDLTNNTTAPFAGTGNAFIGSSADTLGGSGVFFLGMTQRGTYSEEGTVVPSHTRPIGSLFARTNGGGGELYISNGGGSWSKIALV